MIRSSHGDGNREKEGDLIRAGTREQSGTKGLRETRKENSGYGIPMGTGTGRRRGVDKGRDPGSKGGRSTGDGIEELGRWGSHGDGNREKEGD